MIPAIPSGSCFADGLGTTSIRSITLAGSGTLEADRIAGDAEATIAGSGSARLMGVEAEKLEVTIAGSGALEAAGKANSLELTVAGSGSAKMADLKGKRVSTGSPGSATEVMAFRVIEAAGLDKDKDMERERLGVAESVNAIKDGKIDAFFWVGGLPTAAVTDLANTPGTTIRMIDHADVVPKMNAKYGDLYVQDTIGKSVYKGMAADNQQATVWNILVAHETMDDKTAYDIVKTIFDKQSDLIAVHKEAASFKLENQKTSATPVPYHPGAIKYFAEKGVKLQ